MMMKAERGLPMQKNEDSGEDTVFHRKKKFLKRYQRILKKIERLDEKIGEIESQLTSVQSQRITDMPRGGQPVSAAELISDRDETRIRKAALLEQAKEIRMEIYMALDTLEDYREVEVLELFFIYCMGLEEISDKMGYTIRHTIRFYSSAIRNLDEDVTNVSVKCQ